MPAFPVYNSEGKETESLDLPESLFTKTINRNVIHQAIVMYQAGQRQGNAKTKGRAEVSGGGKKPYRQKGTGRARAGSIRSPLWHKGGIVFGPQPRDFGYSVPQKIKLAALRESLNAKIVDNNLMCVDQLKATTDKTKDFAKILSKLNLKGSTILALLDGNDDKVARASRNIPFLSVMRSEDVNANHILGNKKVLITKTAFKNLLKRIE